MKNITICILRICALNTIGYVGNRAGQRSLGKFRKVREDNIKIDVNEIVCEHVRCIHLLQ